MPLPEFDSQGDLPVGLHTANMVEVTARFGQGNKARRDLMELLERIHKQIAATNKLLRFVVFGSFVTTKTVPRDVDIILVMADDFSLAACDAETRIFFDHQRAEEEVGASIFWVCPSILLRESLDEFLQGWGSKRDMTRRGIVEVVE